MSTNRERQLDEVTVLESMFGEQLVDVDTDGTVSFTLRAEEGEARLRVRLPLGYPAEAPELELSCVGATAAALNEAHAELLALAAATTSDREPGDAEESCAAVAQRFTELSAAELSSPPPTTATPSTTNTAAEAVEEAVVVIDHMNEAVPYMRLLERWASEEGLEGAVLYAGGDGSGRRVHGVTVVLQGGAAGVGGFLQRLRTELVDVDAKGRRCRERQSTVLCRRPHGAHAEGYPPAVRLEGWAVRQYVQPEERDALLDEMRLLHVGTGATRFATAAEAT